MHKRDHYSHFVSSVQKGDVQSANLALIRELGSILVRNRQDFVHLLNESGIKASIKDADVHLVNLFINNIGTNKKLTLGTALLINMYNKQPSFDGTDEVSDEGVKGAYLVLNSSFCEEDKEYSNAGGILAALGGIAQGGVGLANKLTPDKNAAMNLAQSKQTAQAAMTQQILAARQTQLDAASKASAEKSKRTKILIIGGISVVVIGLVIGGIYLIKKRRAKKG